LLHKNIIEDAGKGELIDLIEETKNYIIKLLQSIKVESLNNFIFNDKIDIEDILKMQEVRFVEKYDTVAELLYKYMTILSQISKVKVYIISLSFLFLSESEINELLKYCLNNSLIMIFIEQELPKNIDTSNFQIFYLDDDIIIEK